MDHGALGLPVSGYLMAAIAYGAFALRALPRRTPSAGSGAAVALFLAALASLAWALCGLLVPQDARPLAALHGLTDTARYAAWLCFVLLLLSPVRRRPLGDRSWLYAAVAALLVVAAIAFHVLAANEGRSAGLYTRLSLFVSLALPVFGLVLAEQLFRNTAEESRWGVKPLCLGLACIFVFDLYLYSEAVLFGGFDDDALSIRALVHAFAVPLLFAASQRNSDWVARVRVSRSAAFHSVALLLAGVYLLFISGLGYYVRYFGGAWGRALQLGTLTVALLALAAVVLSGSMRAKLRVALGKHFFSYRYDYRREWLRFTATLASGTTPQAMGGLVIRGLADMLESPAGALWSKAAGDSDYVQAAHWNLPRLTDREPVGSAFAAFLRQRGWIIDLEEYRARPQRYDKLELPAWLLADPQFWLVVPLLVGDELIGFVVLARARTSVDVNWEVTDLLKTASRQAASFLAQMRATEALLEVRKFDAFNRMSAFVVHDLKNIVTQLSLMMKNAQRLRDNPEFRDDMLLTIESSLDKMRRLMLQLREGEAPPGGTSGVALLPILRRIEAVAAGRGRALEVDVVDRAVTRGHEERIERVLGHVVQNAFDATPPSGRVWVRLARKAGQARVEVGDSGQGMSAEFVESRLFKPFQTTKATGMGIGAYESFQYIHELGGSIAVDSELGRGTTVTILMPLFDTRESSDLHPLGER